MKGVAIAITFKVYCPHCDEPVSYEADMGRDTGPVVFLADDVLNSRVPSTQTCEYCEKEFDMPTEALIAEDTPVYDRRSCEGGLCGECIACRQERDDYGEKIS